MTTPVLGFKTGDSSLIISPKTCVSWPGSDTYLESSDLNTVLCGVRSSPFFGTDSNGNAGGPRNTCTNQLFANVNALYFRNITNPSVIVQKIPTTLIGNVTTANERVHRLSGGDIGSDNSLVGNIFNPSLIGEKYYGINGIRFFNSPGECIQTICQPREIHYTLRNIFNPRDKVIQRVRYNRDSSSSVEVNNIQQNPDEFLTQVQWMYSPSIDGGFYGIGNITDAKGKAIEMKGVTDSNIGSFSKDPLVKIIYEQLCTRWTCTPYIDYGNGSGYVVANTNPFGVVELKEKIRNSSDILYSDYYEGISSAKKVRYFEIIDKDNNKTGELYAVIDISKGTPKIKIFFDFAALSDLTPYKTIDTGFDPSNLSSYVGRLNFTPDMELTWGSLPDITALKTTYAMDLSGKTTNLTIDLDKLKNNYFITPGWAESKRALLVFTPNCSNVASCILSSDCFSFGKQICQQGKCIECTQSDKTACTSNQQCYQNVCTNNITCSSTSACPPGQPFLFCNNTLGRCVNCNTNADCGTGQFCNILKGNICETASITPVCITNTDCSEEKECINRICVVKNESTSKINIPLILGISIGVLLIIYILVKLSIKK
jgi:hypothetical protein